MNKNDQKVLILRETILELRRRYDFINNIYRYTSLKTITFMGAGFGLLSYLYSDASKTNLFIPEEIYGKIFYVLAISLILGAMTILFSSIKGSRWEFPCHEIKLKDIENENHLIFLKYVRDEYLRTTKLNLITYETKQKILNTSSLMLSIGGILVVLIKVFK